MFVDATSDTEPQPESTSIVLASANTGARRIRADAFDG
jgi:hypothetical protein